MTSEQEGNTEIPKGHPPNEEQLFYIEWGRETLKENIANLNSAFKLFITLDTTLLSAYLGFYEKAFGNTFSYTWQAILPAGAIFFSLVTSIVGFFPWSISVDLTKPSKISEYKEKREKHKSYCLIFAAVMLVVGLAGLLLARLFPVPGSSLITSPLPTPTP
jgi:hypothetical protein